LTPTTTSLTSFSPFVPGVTGALATSTAPPGQTAAAAGPQSAGVCNFAPDDDNDSCSNDDDLPSHTGQGASLKMGGMLWVVCLVLSCWFAGEWLGLNYIEGRITGVVL
jgi:hypothetical protein